MKNFNKGDIMDHRYYPQEKILFMQRRARMRQLLGFGSYLIGQGYNAREKVKMKKADKTSCLDTC